jgi:hypothetical protein
MSRFLFKIVDTFWMEKIGLVVAADVRAGDVSLRAGEPIELRRPDGSRLKTEVAAIAMVCPSDPDRPLDFSLPRGVGKGDVPVGTEVWAPQ